jgi:hypothetical protein
MHRYQSDGITAANPFKDADEQTHDRRRKPQRCFVKDGPATSIAAVRACDFAVDNPEIGPRLDRPENALCHYLATGLLLRLSSPNVISSNSATVSPKSAPVERYEVPGLGALNFVLHRPANESATRSLALDAHGKTLSFVLLKMDLDV